MGIGFPDLNVLLNAASQELLGRPVAQRSAFHYMENRFPEIELAAESSYRESLGHAVAVHSAVCVFITASGPNGLAQSCFLPPRSGFFKYVVMSSQRIPPAGPPAHPTQKTIFSQRRNSLLKVLLLNNSYFILQMFLFVNNMSLEQDCERVS